MNKPLLGALCALIPVIALGETDTTLSPIVASDTRSRDVASRTPTNIQVIDQAEIAASGADTLAELLAGRAGIFVTDTYGDGATASLDMRGFGDAAGDNVLVTVNGRRLNPSSDSASLYLNSIELDNVERVEVVQGSAAILYGNMAVGGLINIITREPGDPERRVRIAAGSYDSIETSATTSARNDSGWGYRLTARARNSDNYRDRNDTRLRRMALLTDHKDEAGRVFLELDYFAEFQQTPGALFADELAADRRQSAYDNDYIDTQSRQARLGLHRRLTDTWRFEGELGYRVDDRRFVQSFRAFPGTPATQDRRIWTFNPRLIGRFGDNVLTLGADWENTDYLLVSSFGPQGVDQDIRALYGQWVRSLDARTDLTVGLRHARIGNDIYDGTTTTPLDDSVTVGSLGLSYRPTGQWRLFARAEQNYRFAKVDEHTNPVFGQPIGLKNPKGISYELGAQYAHRGIKASAVAYRLDIEDEIGFDASGFYNINLDHTRRYGLQLALQAPLDDRLLAGVSADLTNGELTDGPYEGNRIPNVPRYQLRGFVEWAATARTDLYLEALHVGDRVLGADHDNSYPKLAAYTVFNLRAGYRLADWTFDARINNLLDRRYIASGALGYDAGFTVTPGYNAAPERNLWLGARYQF